MLLLVLLLKYVYAVISVPHLGPGNSRIDPIHFWQDGIIHA